MFKQALLFTILDFTQSSLAGQFELDIVEAAISQIYTPMVMLPLKSN